MGTSTEHQFPNERPEHECFQAEYFGFAETDRVDNIPPNFVDDILIKFLSLGDHSVKSTTRCNVALVVPEVCTQVSAENGLNHESVKESKINFKRIENPKDVNKFAPVKVLLRIEGTIIEIYAIEPAVRLLTHSLCNITFCSQGIAHPEYFGFIVTSSVDLSLNLTTSQSSSTSLTSKCQVFRCCSEIQVAQVMQALKSAFSTISSSSLHATAPSSSSSSSASSVSSSSLFPALFRSQQNVQHPPPPLPTPPPFKQDDKNFLSKALGPIERLNGLCREIQTKSFAEAHEILERFIEVHHSEEHGYILRKVQEAGCETLQETNEIIVSCLLRLAEDKPPLHSPGPPKPSSSSSSSFSPAAPVHHCGLGALGGFSASNSQLGRSTAGRYDDGIGGGGCAGENFGDSRVAAEVVGRSQDKFPENSPMRTMFANVGNNLGKVQTKKSIPEPSSEVMNHLKSRQALTTTAATDSYSNNNKSGGHNHHHHRRPHNHRHQQQQQQLFPPGSWRFGILNKVLTSSKAGLSSVDYSRYLKDLRHTPAVKINYLWRKAIVDTMYLIKLNRGRNDGEEEEEEEEEDGFEEVPSMERQVRQMKADYDEITPCLVEVTKVWEEMLSAAASNQDLLLDRKVIVSAMRAGVPRNRRGDIWIFLMNQKLLELSKTSHLTSSSSSSSSLPPSSSSSSPMPPQTGTSYRDLLKMWTQHQHAILIDLGRTFPGHPYFSTQLGSGQISLFNILKAYSLLDAEVGYCQGISFVAGILLLHISEEMSFDVLKFMMFTLNFRRQYCPDMVHLQIQLYQLSRLLHDLHGDLYDHLDRLEISPTLYAAPWFLTIFASQFPLGFVARVFDLIFLQGCDVVIQVAVILLGNHKELIKQCDGFEAVVEFLKTTLPEMSTIQMERIISQAFDLNISKQLDAYKIEYHVLRDEMLALKASSMAAAKAKADGSSLSAAAAAKDAISKGASNVSDGSVLALMSHQDLVAKVHELTSKNHYLLQQVKELQSKFNSSNNGVDGVVVFPDRDQSRLRAEHSSAAACSASRFHDLLAYSNGVESLLLRAKPHLPEQLRMEMDGVESTMRPKWLGASEDAISLSFSGMELQGSLSALSYAAPSSHPATLPVKPASHVSSGAPTPLWPLSPLSDGGIGCFLDREVEDFINIGVAVPQCRGILAEDNDDEMRRKILRNKSQGVPYRQRPSSNYY